MKLATLCYVQRDGKTLMLHRTKKENDSHAGKWIGLGGKLEATESPEECVVREVWEESGLQLEKPVLKGIITFPSNFGKDDWYVFVYSCNEFTGELIDSPEGVLEWIDNSALLDLDVWDGDKVFMQWIDQHDVFSVKFRYEDGKMKDYTVNFY